MNEKELRLKLEKAIDALANVEHERWAHWQRYVHENSIKQPDGSLIIPAELVHRWEIQIAKPYSSLSEDEKESDRQQVRKYIPAVVFALER